MSELAPDVGYRPAMNPKFVKQARQNETRRKLAREREMLESERREIQKQRQKMLFQRIELEKLTKRSAEEVAKARSDLEAIEAARVNFTAFDTIERRFCCVFGVTKADLHSPRRSAHISLCRHAIGYWACRRTKQSLQWIGNRMNRDHTSIIHARDTYPDKRARMGRTLRRVRPKSQ